MHGQPWHYVIANDHAHHERARILGKMLWDEAAGRRKGNTFYVWIFAFELERHDHRRAGAQTMPGHQQLIGRIGAERVVQQIVRLDAIVNVFGIVQDAQVTRLICQVVHIEVAHASIQIGDDVSDKQN